MSSKQVWVVLGKAHHGCRVKVECVVSDKKAAVEIQGQLQKTDHSLLWEVTSSTYYFEVR